MSIVNDVPRFSEKTTSQKGHTCWYYATKMLLKFHDLFDRGAKGPDHPLETMHTMRRLITQAKTREFTEFYDSLSRPVRHPLGATLPKLEQERTTLRGGGNSPVIAALLALASCTYIWWSRHTFTTLNRVTCLPQA